MAQIVFQMKLSHVVIDIIVSQLTVHWLGEKCWGKSVSNCPIIFLKNSSSICKDWFQNVRALAPSFSDETNERSYTSLYYTSTNCCISQKLHQKPMKWALKIKVIGEENWTSFLGFFFYKEKGVYIGTKWGLEFLLFIYRLQR